MKLTSLIELVVAMTSSAFTAAFFTQAAKIGGLNAMPLCGHAIVWLVVAMTAWALLILHLKTHINIEQ